jgi:aminopeptidase N
MFEMLNGLLKLDNSTIKMQHYFIILVLLLITKQNILAQQDCLNDPSCQHTKSMLLEASRQWEDKYTGINTNKRCDSLDILHYTVILDMSDHVGERVIGSCAVRFKTKKEKVQALPLDLLQFQVDSVLMNGKKLVFDYNDTLLNIHFSEVLAQEKEQTATVYYQGHPQTDKRWGGFYYKEEYAYNLGVGFASDPHNYGRVWHPCFDNFRERASYTFHITTTNEQRAHCNGYLQAENRLNGLTTRTWQQKEPIPTYLACIAVGDYVTIKQSHQGIEAVVPIELAANAADTANLKKSFVHLKKAIETYEYWYGPHRWAKVGYSLVPFRSGAMEHVSNIAYPINSANGTLKREHLMVHELGHSWWGNLVTCATAQDMWINEGMASYSEDLFWEYTYGWERYIEDVKKNHYNVLKVAHQQESGYRPISGVPHEYTYGIHVYDKGAAVVHNMRWYMGDEAFRKGLHYITKTYAFQNLTTAGFRDALITSTGIDMNPFFDDWVFRGGFPHFEVEGFEVKAKNKGFEVEVAIGQKLVGRTVYFKEVPLQVTFLDDNWNKFQAVVEVSDSLDKVSVQVPFAPTSIIINEEHRLNQARYDEALSFKSTDSVTASIQLKDLDIEELVVRSQSDSTWLHLQHHPVPPPKQQVLEGYTISKNHYWTVDGVLSKDFDAEAIVKNHGKWDADLTENGTDSLVLLYRPNPNAAWQIHPNFIKSNFFNKTIFTFSILKGDYAFANGAVPPQVHEVQKEVKFSRFELSQENTTLQIDLATASKQKACVELYNQAGVIVYEKCVALSAKLKTLKVEVASLEKGIYFLKVRNGKGKVLGAQRVVL